jgi:hypothetical protein
LLTLGEGTVEVAHEALITRWPRLQRWLDEDVHGRQLRQNLTLAAWQWRDGGREPSELYRGARLAATLDWTAAHREELNELEREFLSESRQAGQREAERQRRINRRLRGLLAGVAALFVLAWSQARSRSYKEEAPNAPPVGPSGRRPWPCRRASALKRFRSHVSTPLSCWPARQRRSASL